MMIETTEIDVTATKRRDLKVMINSTLDWMIGRSRLTSIIATIILASAIFFPLFTVFGMLENKSVNLGIDGWSQIALYTLLSGLPYGVLGFILHGPLFLPKWLARKNHSYSSGSFFKVKN